jgi:plasmid maintenance system antidote protein VapI
MSRATAERERRHQRRKAAKRETAEQLARTLLDLSVDQEELAEILGVGPSIVQRMCDRQRLETISIADILQIGEERADAVHGTGDDRYANLARSLLSWAARKVGLDVVTKLRAVGPGDHLAHLAHRMRENGESVAVHMEALADGIVDDGELAKIDRELRDSEQANAEARAWVDAERAERARKRAAG